MYLASDIAKQDARFRNQKICHDDFIGKIKHQTDLPITSLLSYNTEDSKDKIPQLKPNNCNWVSDSYCTYHSYFLLSPNFPLPSSAYHPKPIPENDLEPLDQISIKNNKKPNTSPKPRGNWNSHLPQAPKQPSGKILHKKTSKKQANSEKYIQNTRSMPDSSFKTHFGKPVFANYGHANKNPIYGGFLYGNYMKSYNAAPSELKVLENEQEKDMKKQDEVQILTRKCKDGNKVPCFEVESKLNQKSNILPNGKSMKIKDIPEAELIEKKNEKNGKKTTIGDNNIEKNEEIIGKRHENAKKVPGQVKTLMPKSFSAREILVPQALLTNPTNTKNIKEQPEITNHPIIKSQILSKNQNKSIKAHDHEISPACHNETGQKVPSENTNQVFKPQKYCPRCNNTLNKNDQIPALFSTKQTPPQELLQKTPAAGKLTSRSPSAYTLIFESNHL